MDKLNSSGSQNSPAVRWPDFEHTGPGTIAGQYMRSFWQPVHLSASLERGRAKPLNVMSQQFTLYRTESGRAQVVADRCLHRGTALWTGTVEGEALQCFYHGWQYDVQGKCIARPAETTCPAHLHIRSYPTQEWAGFIFAFLGEGEPPPFPMLDVFNGSGALVANAPIRPFNYFSQIENGMDEVHFNFVHRISRFTEQGMNSEIPKLSCEETAYGLARISTRAGVKRLNHFLMPNANIAILFGAWHLVWRVPIDDHSHISFTVDYFDGSQDEVRNWRIQQEALVARIAAAAPAAEVAAAVLRGEIQLKDALDHPDLLSVQDGVALAGQGVIANRKNELLGHSDMQIIRMRRLWAQDLTHIQEGRASRRWVWPRHLEMTTGLKKDEVT